MTNLLGLLNHFEYNHTWWISFAYKAIMIFYFWFDNFTLSPNLNESPYCHVGKRDNDGLSAVLFHYHFVRFWAKILRINMHSLLYRKTCYLTKINEMEMGIKSFLTVFWLYVSYVQYAWFLWLQYFPQFWVSCPFLSSDSFLLWTWY